jgi:hypothetical protein
VWNEDFGEKQKELRHVNTKAVLATCFRACFLLGLFFDHEDGDDIFLRNVG